MDFRSWPLNFNQTIKIKAFYYIKTKLYLYFNILNILKTQFIHFTLFFLLCHSDPIHPKPPLHSPPKIIPHHLVPLSLLLPPATLPLAAPWCHNCHHPTGWGHGLFFFLKKIFIGAFDWTNHGHVKFQQKLSKNSTRGCLSGTNFINVINK